MYAFFRTHTADEYKNGIVEDTLKGVFVVHARFDNICHGVLYNFSDNGKVGSLPEVPVFNAPLEKITNGLFALLTSFGVQLHYCLLFGYVYEKLWINVGECVNLYVIRFHQDFDGIALSSLGIVKQVGVNVFFGL